MGARAMLHVQTAEKVVGPFESQTAAEQFAATHGGDLIDPILDPQGGTRVWTLEEFERSERPRFRVIRTAQGWGMSPPLPKPGAMTPVADGWASIRDHREACGAIDWFETESDYDAFVAEFGEPPPTEGS